MAQRVAKVICLLQYVQQCASQRGEHRGGTAGDVAGDSPIAQVREALAELVRTHNIRLGDDGYRIPTPAEDDWERIRNGISPRGGETNRIYAEILTGFWSPQPTHLLADAKAFKAGLHINGRELVAGDIAFHFSLADEGEAFMAAATQARSRSQQNPTEVCWAVAVTKAIDDEQVELFRSREMLQRKERDTKGDDTPGLMAEERARLNKHQENLRKLLRDACLTGRVYFRGNDRTPGERVAEVGRATEEILRDGLPQIFDHYVEAAAKVTDARKGVETLVKAHNLQGLTPIFTQLKLVRTDAGKTVFAVEGGPLREVLRRIEDRANYGDTPNGGYLEGVFAKPPFGWDSDVVRLLVVCLMRAELVEATSKGHVLDSVTTIEAGQTLTNANLFRQATFRPRRGVEPADRVRAGDAFRDTFGRDVTDISSSATIVDEVRQEIARQEEAVVEARDTLRLHRLPGVEGLDDASGHFRAIRSGSVENAITTFNASHRAIKDMIRRTAELRKALTGSTLDDLSRARRIVEVTWPELRGEPDLDVELEPHATELAGLLLIDDFYRNLPAIAEHTQALETDRQRRFDEAQRERIAAFTTAYEQLSMEPGWDALADEDRQDIAAQLIDGQQSRRRHNLTRPAAVGARCVPGPAASSRAAAARDGRR